MVFIAGLHFATSLVRWSSNRVAWFDPFCCHDRASGLFVLSCTLLKEGVPVNVVAFFLLIVEILGVDLMRVFLAVVNLVNGDTSFCDFLFVCIIILGMENTISRNTTRNIPTGKDGVITRSGDERCPAETGQLTSQSTRELKL